MTPWIKLDDGLHSHPKIIEAWSIDRAGVGLHLRALSYAADHLTDGHIRESWVAELFRVESERTSAVGALLQSGLWERNDDGYLIHDYLEFNESRADVLARREKDTTRKRGGR